MTVEIEQQAWDWLSEGGHREHPADRVYSADEIVEAWMAGYSNGHRSAEADAAGLREVGESVAAIVNEILTEGPLEFAVAGNPKAAADFEVRACVALDNFKQALAARQNGGT